MLIVAAVAGAGSIFIKQGAYDLSSINEMTNRMALYIALKQ